MSLKVGKKVIIYTHNIFSGIDLFGYKGTIENVSKADHPWNDSFQVSVIVNGRVSYVVIRASKLQLLNYKKLKVNTKCVMLKDYNDLKAGDIVNINEVYSNYYEVFCHTKGYYSVLLHDVKPTVNFITTQPKNQPINFPVNANWSKTTIEKKI